MSGCVPAKLAAAFTMGEIAVLTAIARQCARSGVCVLPVDAIAALAGVCRRTVLAALAHARLVKLVLVKERRIPGRRSLTNVIQIISPEWLAWLQLGGGRKKLHPTDNQAFNSAASGPPLRTQGEFDREKRKIWAKGAARGNEMRL